MELIHVRRLGFFVILYFVQGVALAYFTGFQKRYLIGVGIDPDRIAMLTMLVLVPFILKPIIGLIADSIELNRKVMIAMGLGIAAVSFVSACWANPGENFWFFGALMVLASCGVATFDTIADALAVDAFEGREYGSLQSAMLAGKSLGLILFSVIFGVLIDSRGYGSVFVFIGGAMLVPFMVWRGVRPVPRRERFVWSVFRVLAKKHVIAIAVFGVLYSIPSFGVSGLFSYYFTQLGFAATQVGWFESVKSIGAVVGALAFGGLVRQFDFKSIAVVATIAAVVVSVAVPWSVTHAFCYLIVALFGVVWALRETVYTTIAMQATEPAIAATMFSLLMAFSNLGTSIGEGWATSLAGRHGFDVTFTLFGLLNVLSLIYFWRLSRPSLQTTNKP